MKYRALKLDHGNYAWPGEAVTRKCRILGVVYNPTNMEFVRTNTLVKGSIIQIDATPFKNWYQKHYGVTVGKAVEYVKERKQRKIKKLSDKLAVDRVARKEAQKKADAIKAALQAKKEAEQKKEKKKAKGADKKMKESVGKEKKGGKAEKPGEKKGKASEKKAETKKTVEKKAEKGKDTKAKEIKGKAKADVKPKGEAAKKAVTAKDESKPKKPKKESDKKKEVKKKREKDSRKKKLKPGQKHHPSGAMMKRWRLRNATRVLESGIAEQFDKGRLFAKIATSPGQVGSADGYVLEGEELAFYVKRMALKKKK